jgi:hypothetical protein
LKRNYMCGYEKKMDEYHWARLWAGRPGYWVSIPGRGTQHLGRFGDHSACMQWVLGALQNVKLGKQLLAVLMSRAVGDTSLQKT